MASTTTSTRPSVHKSLCPVSGEIRIRRRHFLGKISDIGNLN